VSAGLSPDYYTRLEQGRQSTISHEVLTALARALRLDDVEAAHLRELAAPTLRSHRRSSTSVQRPDPGLLRLMTQLDHLPVLLLGYRGDVLARNTLLRVVLGTDLAPGTSFPRYFFEDPTARERIVNWPDFASALIGALRSETGRRPYDRRLIALIDTIIAKDQDAARWWNDHGVRDYASVTKRIAHPTGGNLDFDIEIVSPPHEPEQRLVIYTAEPHSTTAHMLPLLASWDADTVAADKA